MRSLKNGRQGHLGNRQHAHSTPQEPFQEGPDKLYHMFRLMTCQNAKLSMARDRLPRC